MSYSEADLDCIRANYATLEELCVGRQGSPHDVQALIDARRLSEASYVLEDGTGMFRRLLPTARRRRRPEQRRRHFAERLRAAGVDGVDDEWDASCVASTASACER